MKKEDKKKIVKKIFKKIFIAILVGFTALYISEATGYYEYEQHKNVSLTKDRIKQFEEDVASGKNVDVLDYIETSKDYTSPISKLGLKISDNLSDLVKTSLERAFNFLGKMFKE